MQKPSVQRSWLLASLLVVAGFIALWSVRTPNTEEATLPLAVTVPPLDQEPIDAQPERSVQPLAVTAPPPTELNLAVPFTAQAPFGNWDTAHEEYCEEASLLMAARYFAGETFASPDDADQALTDIADWQQVTLGYFESTNAEETARIGREFLGLDIEITKDVRRDTVYQALNAGSLVLVPAAGRQLGNPYFQRPGPIYHMLVIKGYTTDDRFITNDPGTRRGADFTYSTRTLLAAAHDYNHGAVDDGTPLLLIVRRKH